MEQNTNNTQTNNQGFFAQPRAFLKGEYLTLVLPGNMIVRKHVNFYKAILGVPFTPKANIKEIEK